MSDTSPGFEILDEDGPCLVIAKPAGIPTQAPPQYDSLEQRIKRFLKQRENHPGQPYLGVPHRLDRPVSGVMLLARNVRATRRLAEQFQGRTITKKYWAIVEGHLPVENGTWVDWMRKIPGVAQAEILDQGHPDGRKALLHFRVLRQSCDWAWLEIELETGRTHQIRLQAASRGFPILGDHQYGATRPFGPSVQHKRDKWIGLHARSITFRHPMTNTQKRKTAPLSNSWQELLDN
ncbi:MAG: RNA pseudouridine synthase [Planctomycetota bacterium]|nr:RNA pseudouridine synthase [Planctomycetota bacterium]